MKQKTHAIRPCICSMKANWEISQIWLVISHRPSPPFYGLKPEGIGSIHDTEAFGVYPASVGSLTSRTGRAFSAFVYKRLHTFFLLVPC